MGHCPHPKEELQQVFAGGQLPLAGRRYCGLCGALVFPSQPAGLTTELASFAPTPAPLTVR